MDSVESLTFEGYFTPGAVALIAAALVGATVWAMIRARAPLGVRAGVVALRTAAVAALVIALLGPVRVTRGELVLKPPLLILADASQSMGVRDAAGGASRREATVAALEKARPDFERLAEVYEVSRFDFGDDVSEVLEWSPAADRRLTALGDAVSNLVRRQKGRTGGRIVVLSDGRNTSGADPVRAATLAADRGVTVHAVGVGSSGGPTLRDRRVSNLLCPSSAQVQAAVSIHGYVACFGERGRTLKVILKIDGARADVREIPVDADAFSTRVSFTHTPTEAGERRVTVEVEKAEGEFDPENNAMSTFMRVLHKDLRILYLEGRLRWEFTFLKRALARIPGAHFEARNLLADRTAADLKELETFNVVVLGDIARPGVGNPFLEALERHVSAKEAGLLFLAGPGNLAPEAGWSGTPMEILLPFELEGAGALEERPAKVRLTDFGRTHFAVTLDHDAGRNVAAWEALPDLEAVARVGRPKAGATVLARTDRGEPLLVAQPFGRGRVLAFLGESAWKWALGSDASAEKYRRFWHQCVLWLARKEWSARRLTIELPRYIYTVGDPVEVTANVENPPGSPVPDAAVRLTVQGGDAALPPVSTSYYGGAYHATLPAEKPGEFQLVAEARRGTDDYGKVAARFSVVSPSAELDFPSADPELLMAVASAGGGTFRPIEEIGGLRPVLEKEAQPVRIPRVHRKSLWDRPWLVLLFVSALAAEWILRKRFRML